MSPISWRRRPACRKPMPPGVSMRCRSVQGNSGKTGDRCPGRGRSSARGHTRRGDLECGWDADWSICRQPLCQVERESTRQLLREGTRRSVRRHVGSNPVCAIAFTDPSATSTIATISPYSTISRPLAFGLPETARSRHAAWRRLHHAWSIGERGATLRSAGDGAPQGWDEPNGAPVRADAQVAQTLLLHFKLVQLAPSTLQPCPINTGQAATLCLFLWHGSPISNSTNDSTFASQRWTVSQGC
jgi:hypothetical protein